MKGDFKSLFGRQLRKEFHVPDDLPFPMRKALEELAEARTYTADADDAESRDTPEDTITARARNKE